MPRPNVKTRAKTANRREHILATTLAVIATDGVAGVTHRRVAEAAGVPLGSTTYYFDSLQHLLREAFMHHVARAEQIYDDALERPIEHVEDLADYLVALTEREFDEPRFLLVEYELTVFAARDGQVAEALERWDASMVAALARHLERLGAAAPFEAGTTLLHLMRGHELESLRRTSVDTAPLRARLIRVVNAYLAD